MSIACKISTLQPNTFAAILFPPPCQTASALFINCQTWALNTRPSSLRGAGFRLNWVPCGSSARQTVPAQLKILGVRLGLFFATAETKLLSFFSLSNHWQWFCQGASAGRQECERGLRQRWLRGALAPVTSAGLQQQQRSARHRHGRHRGQYTAAPCPVAAPHHTSAAPALAVGKSSTQSRSHPEF